MSHRNRSLKILSLAFLAMAGLMAFMAAGAQASEKSWLENNADITANKLVEVGKHTAEFVLDVPSKGPLEVLCTEVEGKDVLLVVGTTTATGELWFTACKVLQAGVVQGNCTVDTVKAGGKAKLILHGSPAKNYILFEPAVAGGNFAVIKFLGELCALPESNAVKGALVAECLKASNLEEVDCAQSELTHLLREALNAAALFGAGDTLKYGSGEVAANVLGVAKAKLESDNPWAGHV